MSFSKSRRPKLFGAGRPQPLCREAKVRVMHLARALSRHTAKGEAYGHRIAPKALEVLEVLLWRFHNAKSGLCFPSYDTIAKAAGCARSTAAAALKALEAAGVLTWVNRLVRRRDPLGGRARVMRTSNGYQFEDPKGADSSKSDRRTRTESQASSPSLTPPALPEIDMATDLGAALLRYREARDRRMQPA